MNNMNDLYQLDSAVLSDALDACGIEGALLNIKPLSFCKKMVGPAFTVKYLPYEHNTEFQNAGNYIDAVPKNAIIVIDNQGRTDCTTWGGILTQVAMLRDIAGTVVHGGVRDIRFIRDSSYSLYATSFYMRSGKNRVYKAEQQGEIFVSGVKILPNDIIFGDCNGVIVIPQAHLTEIIAKAKNVMATEEAIISSVKSGFSLKDARSKYRYDQPWSNDCNEQI